MNAEFKRMMQLAGLTEIKINPPKSYKKLNLPDLSRFADTLIDIQDIEEHYDDLINDLVKLNPQIDPYLFQADNDGLFSDILDEISYYQQNGVTLKQFYMIYFTWLFATIVYDITKYDEEELDSRLETFAGQNQELPKVL